MIDTAGADAIRRYRDEGYLFPIDVLSAAEAADCRRKLERFDAEHGLIAGPQRTKLHLLLTWMDDLIRHPRILDAVEAVLGPDILCWSTSIFLKEPKDPSYISWHQDGTYWGLSSADVTTAWLALSLSTRESGCVKFMPRTHLAPVRHRDTFAPDNALTRGQEVEVKVNEDEAVHVVLKPGQASLHHILLFHGSEPNVSDDRRIGLAIRYVAAGVHRTDGRRDSAMLVRGADRGHFDLEPRPSADMAPDAVAAHARIVGARRKALTDGAAR